MKFLLLAIFLLAAASSGFVGYIVWFFPAKIEGELVISNIFYFLLAAGLAIGSSLTLIFYFFGRLFLPRIRTLDPAYPAKRLLIRSLRRSFLIATLATTLAALNIFNFLNLLNASLVVGIAVLIEIYFSSR